VSTGFLLLLVLELADTEVEYASLCQIVLISLSSVPVDRHQAAAFLVVLASLAKMCWIRLTGDTSPQASVTLQTYLVSCSMINCMYTPQICTCLPLTPFQVQDPPVRALHDVCGFCEAKFPSTCEN
jgi:hypothetical protein